MASDHRTLLYGASTIRGFTGDSLTMSLDPDTLHVHTMVVDTQTVGNDIHVMGDVLVDGGATVSQDLKADGGIQVTGDAEISGKIKADDIENFTQAPAAHLMTIKNAVGDIKLDPTTYTIILNVPTYVDNAAAVAAGRAAGTLYRTGADPDYLAIVH